MGHSEPGMTLCATSTPRLRLEDACTQVQVGVEWGTRHNAVRAFDAHPAWGSAHVGVRIDGCPVSEVGTTELWLPAA
jgi:hypothetical protein